MSRGMKFASWSVSLVLFSLCPLLVYGQYPDAQSDQSAMGQNNMGKQATSVTGCIKQGQETGGYYLTTSDGKIYELSGKADISKHVNHTVTVTGHEHMLSKAEEAKMEQNEKTEAGGKSYADLHVTSLKMVSDSCSQ